MKKYLFGLLAIVLAVGLSAFTTKKAPFTLYVYKYVGPGTMSASEIQDRANWNVKITSPFTQCTTGFAEDNACTFTTSNVSSYLTSIGSDLYQPSTDIRVVAKASDLGGSVDVVDKAQLVSDNSTISQSVENIDIP